MCDIAGMSTPSGRGVAAIVLASVVVLVVPAPSWGRGVALASAARKEAGPPAVGALPRTTLLWRHGPVQAAYTVTIGSTHFMGGFTGAVESLDLTSGKTNWRLQLPAKVGPMRAFAVAGGTVLVASRKDEDKSTTITRVNADDGKILGSSKIDAAVTGARTIAGVPYLYCRTDLDVPYNLIGIESATGAVRSRARASGWLFGTPSGTICSSDRTTTWCGRLNDAADEIKKLWEQPNRDQGVELFVSNETVVRINRDVVDAFRVMDGTKAWERPRTGPVHFQQEIGRVFLFDNRSTTIAIVRAVDGVLAGTVSCSVGIADRFASDATHAFINGRDGLGCIIDKQARVQMVEHRAPPGDHRGVVMAGGFLLVADSSPEAEADSFVSLEAYSLSRLSPPANRAAPYDRVLAILGRFSRTEQAEEAWAAIQKVPGARDLLEQVLAKGPPERKAVAAAVAELTRDPRYLAPLQATLDGLRLGGHHDEETAPVVTQAMASIGTLTAAEALLAFWDKNGPRITTPSVRAKVRDIAYAAVWAFSARKSWTQCPEWTLPRVEVDQSRATFGTKHPSFAYAEDARNGWAMMCEAHKDDNKDGEIRVAMAQDGRTFGDELRPFLVLGSGPGTEIDDFIASDPIGRFVAVTRGLCVYLVDTRTGKTTPLPGADGRAESPRIGQHRAVHFSTDGTHALYVRSDGPARSVTVRRNLASGAELVIDPGPGLLSRAFFHEDGKYIVFEMADPPSTLDDQPQLVTTFGDARCQSSMGGWVVPPPEMTVRYRTALVRSGRFVDAELDSYVESSPSTESEVRLVPDGPPQTGGGPGGFILRRGPHRWRSGN